MRQKVDRLIHLQEGAKQPDSPSDALHCYWAFQFKKSSEVQKEVLLSLFVCPQILKETISEQLWQTKHLNVSCMFKGRKMHIFPEYPQSQSELL